MRYVVISALFLAGCTAVPLLRAPEASQPACTASCNAHFNQCPQIFAGFPERGAVECPAEHDMCLKSCQGRAAQPAASQVPPGTARAASPKEARLRELKRLYEEGLVTDEVYRDQQKAILSEP